MLGQKVGYIRVSSIGQNTDRQLDSQHLDKVFVDKASGKDRNRPELQNCMEYLREGDTLYVHSLDRLGRSLMDLEDIVGKLVAKGATVIFVKEQLTFDHSGNNSMGKLLFQIMGAFAEFERNMIRERQAEGIAKAKANGKHLGRKPKLTRAQKKEILVRVNEGASVTEISQSFGVSRATIYNAIKKDYKAA